MRQTSIDQSVIETLVCNSYLEDSHFYFYVTGSCTRKLYYSVADLLFPLEI